MRMRTQACAARTVTDATAAGALAPRGLPRRTRGGVRAVSGAHRRRQWQRDGAGIGGDAAAGEDYPLRELGRELHAADARLAHVYDDEAPLRKRAALRGYSRGGGGGGGGSARARNGAVLQGGGYAGQGERSLSAGGAHQSRLQQPTRIGGKKALTAEELAHREAGFNTMLSGANEERVNDHLRRLKQRMVTSAGTRKRAASAPRRRNWDAPRQSVELASDTRKAPRGPPPPVPLVELARRPGQHPVSKPRKRWDETPQTAHPPLAQRPGSVLPSREQVLSRAEAEPKHEIEHGHEHGTGPESESSPASHSVGEDSHDDLPMMASAVFNDDLPEAPRANDGGLESDAEEPAIAPERISEEDMSLLRASITDLQAVGALPDEPIEEVVEDIGGGLEDAGVAAAPAPLSALDDDIPEEVDEGFVKDDDSNDIDEAFERAGSGDHVQEPRMMSASRVGSGRPTLSGTPARSTRVLSAARKRPASSQPRTKTPQDVSSLRAALARENRAASASRATGRVTRAAPASRESVRSQTATASSKQRGQQQHRGGGESVSHEEKIASVDSPLSAGARGLEKSPETRKEHRMPTAPAPSVAKPRVHIPRLNPKPAASSPPAGAPGALATPRGDALVSALQDRVHKLEPSRQRTLFKLLEKLDRVNEAGMDVSAIFESALQEKDLMVVSKAATQAPPKEHTPAFVGASDAGARVAPAKSLIDERALSSAEASGPQRSAKKIFRIEVASTWGGGRAVGLTAIEVFDAAGKALRTRVFAGGVKAVMVPQLSNGHCRTTAAAHMWLGTLGPPTSAKSGFRKRMEIKVIVDVGESRHATRMRLWNYNRSVADTAKGVKDVRVVDQDDDCRVVFQGTVQKGCGNAQFDYATEFRLDGAPSPSSISAEALVDPPTRAKASPTASIKRAASAGPAGKSARAATHDSPSAKENVKQDVKLAMRKSAKRVGATRAASASAASKPAKSTTSRDAADGHDVKQAMRKSAERVAAVRATSAGGVSQHSRIGLSESVDGNRATRKLYQGAGASPSSPPKQSVTRTSSQSAEETATEAHKATDGKIKRPQSRTTSGESVGSKHAGARVSTGGASGRPTLEMRRSEADAARERAVSARRRAEEAKLRAREEEDRERKARVRKMNADAEKAKRAAATDGVVPSWLGAVPKTHANAATPSPKGKVVTATETSSPKRKPKRAVSAGRRATSAVRGPAPLQPADKPAQSMSRRSMGAVETHAAAGTPALQAAASEGPKKTEEVAVSVGGVEASSEEPASVSVKPLRREADALNASLDSLQYFARTQAGRLSGRGKGQSAADVAAAVASETTPPEVDALTLLVSSPSKEPEELPRPPQVPSSLASEVSTFGVDGDPPPLAHASSARRPELSKRPLPKNDQPDEASAMGAPIAEADNAQMEQPQRAASTDATPAEPTISDDELAEVMREFDDDGPAGAPTNSSKQPSPAKVVPADDVMADSEFEEAIREFDIEEPGAVEEPLDSALAAMAAAAFSAGESDPAAAEGASTGGEAVADGNAVVIPSEPRGQTLELVIHSTWGDSHYVGLAGIEIFDASGSLLAFADSKAAVSASPADINELEEYSDDPRTPEKLLDGTNATSDDMHVWLAPHVPGEANRVTITFDAPTTLGCVRVFNYNKNRIHAARGARHVAMLLDGELIFCGELEKASGLALDALDRATCVLFTDSEAALDAIERRDEETTSVLRDQAQGEDMDTLEAAAESLELVENVAPTAPARVGADGRPMTSASRAPPPLSWKSGAEHAAGAAANTGDEAATGAAEVVAIPADRSNGAAEDNDGVLVGSVLRFELMSTWGDKYYCGLTEIELLDPSGESIEVPSDAVRCVPADLNIIPGYSGDDRTADKLVDGTRVTEDDHHMWLAPWQYNGATEHFVEIKLPHPAAVAAARVWNYNKSTADTYRGVKEVRVTLDGQSLGTHCVRKAPGTSAFNFGQTLRFYPSGAELQRTERIDAAFASAATRVAAGGKGCNHNSAVRQAYDTPLLPCGYVLCVELHGTHGDPYYVGIDGIELLDATGERIDLSEATASASVSVRSLPGHGADARTADKAIDGVVGDRSGAHSWLAPTVADDPPRLWVAFDSPVTLAGVRLWNYSKTPARGAEQVDISLDGATVYQGYLREAAPAPAPPRSQAVVLTNEPKLVEMLRGEVHTVEDEPSVMLFDETAPKEATGKILAKLAAARGGAAVRPGTALR